MWSVLSLRAQCEVRRNRDGEQFAQDACRARLVRQQYRRVFCARRTLSFVYVLEFSTVRKEKLDVEEEVFHA